MRLYTAAFVLTIAAGAAALGYGVAPANASEAPRCSGQWGLLSANPYGPFIGIDAQRRERFGEDCPRNGYEGSGNGIVPREFLEPEE